MVSIRRRSEEPSSAPAGGSTTDPERGAAAEPPATAAYGTQPPPHTSRFEAVPRQGAGPDDAAAAPARAARPAPLPGPGALDDPAYERFGGVNVGAAFFGWMVAVGMTVLLSGIVGAVVLVLGLGGGLGLSSEIDASSVVSTASIVSAAVLLVLLLLAYYSGGYVAGRMSRFDGGRQGVAVWLFALVFGALGALAGWVAGERYDLLAGADLPSVQVATQDLTVAGIVTGVVVLLGTLLAAVAGGKVGRRYHAKVDRAL